MAQFEGITMPPPSLGLDLVSPVDNMNPASALELLNVFPGAGIPSVRLGYTQFADLGSASPIGFMHEFPLADGTAQLIVANTNNLYSVTGTTTGTVTNISSSAGTYTNGDWNFALFANRIYLANDSGADIPQVYDGTGTAQDIVASGGPAGGLDKLWNVSSYKESLYFTELNSMRMWYHASVRETFTSGTPLLKSYDFQYVMRRGGYLIFTGTYTYQNGLNAVDYFMAVSSQGELAFYAGDPEGTSGAWTLVAQFIIGKPLGPRAFVRVNQDIWIVTLQGIVPVSSLFQTDPEQAVNIVSLNVNPLITQYASQVPFSNSWHGFFWPSGRRVYINMPDSSISSTLLVYSIDTKSWTQFSLFSTEHAVMSGKFNNLPYYGSSTGIIYQGETGYADAITPTNIAGESIEFAGRMAFSFYNSRGNYKAFKDIRPIIRTKRGVTLNLGLDTDFKRQATVTTITTAPGNYTPWGSPWGTTATVPGPPTPETFTPWSGDVEYIFDRFAVKGQGHCAAIRFGGSIKNASLQLLGFEIRYDLGGQV